MVQVNLEKCVLVGQWFRLARWVSGFDWQVNFFAVNDCIRASEAA